MKIVIAGSAKLQDKMNEWVEYWNNQDGCLVIDYPQVIPVDSFESLYPGRHKTFFKNITETDILFVANDLKNGIDGYIGAETFAELGFGLTQKLIYEKDIKLILAWMPSQEVACYDEIVLWLKLGWIDQILDLDIKK